MFSETQWHSINGCTSTTHIGSRRTSRRLPSSTRSSESTSLRTSGSWANSPIDVCILITAPPGGYTVFSVQIRIFVIVRRFWFHFLAQCLNWSFVYLFKNLNSRQIPFIFINIFSYHNCVLFKIAPALPLLSWRTILEDDYSFFYGNGSAFSCGFESAIWSTFLDVDKNLMWCPPQRKSSSWLQKSFGTGCADQDSSAGYVLNSWRDTYLLNFWLLLYL